VSPFNDKGCADGEFQLGRNRDLNSSHAASRDDQVPQLACCILKSGIEASMSPKFRRRDDAVAINAMQRRWSNLNLLWSSLSHIWKPGIHPN
jgi:hypothetical protein